VKTAEQAFYANAKSGTFNDGVEFSAEEARLHGQQSRERNCYRGVKIRSPHRSASRQ
jgi:hypothetical protein